MRRSILQVILVSLILAAAHFAQDSAPTQEKTVVVTFHHLKSISVPKPEYPPAATAVRASGVVKVRILVDEKGDVEEAEAVSGHLLLRASAVAAARKAKFVPPTLNSIPVKAQWEIWYNFRGTGDVDNVVNKTVLPLGDLNEKARFFVHPKLKPFRFAGQIRVRTTVDLSTGNVLDAKIESGATVDIDAAVLKAARSTKFEAVLPEFAGLRGSGLLTYRSTDFNRPDRIIRKPQAFIIEKKVLNDLAIELPKPNVVGFSKERLNGTVVVSVVVEPISGMVSAAKALTGPEHLRKLSEDAALNARFKPSFLNGGNSVYVSGKLTYKLGN